MLVSVRPELRSPPTRARQSSVRRAAHRRSLGFPVMALALQADPDQRTSNESDGHDREALGISVVITTLGRVALRGFHPADLV